LCLINTVSAELNLNPGDYVIIPTTFEPGKERAFAISAYSSSPLQLSALNSSDDWKEASIMGEWKGKTAGGCFSNQTWRKWIARAFILDFIYLKQTVRTA
jgi:hypothetical protein